MLEKDAKICPSCETKQPVSGDSGDADAGPTAGGDALWGDFASKPSGAEQPADQAADGWGDSFGTVSTAPATSAALAPVPAQAAAGGSSADFWGAAGTSSDAPAPTGAADFWGGSSATSGQESSELTSDQLREFFLARGEGL